MNTSTKYGKPAIGCYLDQGNYSNDELSREIIGIASGYGMPIDAELQAILDADELTDDQAETLEYASEEAISWLNDQETRSFLYWANEGEANAFGLWANIDGAKEDCAFVSSKDNETPEDDFRGEWLHINDHGNVTLYVRKDGEHARDSWIDQEIWSVV